MIDRAHILDIITPVGGDPADLPFWEGCGRGEFLLHRCGICDRHYWPASRCTVHGDEDMGWVAGTGSGEVYTYTIQHHAYSEAMRSLAPYAVVVIRLDEGPFFHANIAECSLADLHIGLRMTARFVAQDTGLIVPLFVPA